MVEGVTSRVGMAGVAGGSVDEDAAAFGFHLVCHSLLSSCNDQALSAAASMKSCESSSSPFLPAA